MGRVRGGPARDQSRNHLQGSPGGHLADDGILSKTCLIDAVVGRGVVLLSVNQGKAGDEVVFTVEYSTVKLWCMSCSVFAVALRSLRLSRWTDVDCAASGSKPHAIHPSAEWNVLSNRPHLSLATVTWEWLQFLISSIQFDLSLSGLNCICG